MGQMDGEMEGWVGKSPEGRMWGRVDEQLVNGWMDVPADGKAAVGMGSQFGDGWAVHTGRERGMNGWMERQPAEGQGHHLPTAPHQGPAGRRALGIGTAAGTARGPGAGGHAWRGAGTAAGAHPRHEGAAAGAAEVRAPGTPPVWDRARAGGPNKPLCPEEGTRAQANPAHHLSRLRWPAWVWGARVCFWTPTTRHAPARADLCSPTGRRMPCGRRQKASTHRCPARHPAMQGCVPAATRISTSSPGGTTAGCARARCATRALWTWASRGAAACFATSKGAHRLHEPGLQPSHWAWDTPCPGCFLLDLLGTKVSRTCRQVLLPDFSG